MNNELLSPDKNSNFAFLRGLDLQELLYEIENYDLEYRDTLNLPDYVTFGIEIEYENVYRRFVDRFINKNLRNWVSSSDGSLRSGGEINSPIMIDEKKYWEELKKICNYLNKKKADTIHNAGGHIHVGAHVLGYDIQAWQTFLKLYMNYEDILFRFMYGDKLSRRSTLTKYAKPIAENLYEDLNKISKAKDILDIYYILLRYERRQSLNFGNIKNSNLNSTENKNTLEFRNPNATTNHIIWQNNINTCTKMLLSSKNDTINEEFLDYKLNHKFYSDFYIYDEINLKKALEFVDLIFDNNLDKIYFLRQYLKNFQNNYVINKAIYAKKFTK